MLPAGTGRWRGHRSAHRPQHHGFDARGAEDRGGAAGPGLIYCPGLGPRTEVLIHPSSLPSRTLVQAPSTATTVTAAPLSNFFSASPEVFWSARSTEPARRI